jgi:hypothetical protein
MKKWLQQIGAGAVIVLVLIQFVPVAHTNPPETGDVPAPPEVQTIFKRACYDCHSNETKWPWYSRVAPLSFFVAHDVNEGRKEVNFSIWDQYEPRRKSRKRREIAEQVEKGEMPPWYYLPAHPEAKLSAAEKESIIKWAKQS